jgi:hypothetical protein
LPPPFSIFVKLLVCISHRSNSFYMTHPSKYSWFWSTSNLLKIKMFEVPRYVMFSVLLLSSRFIDQRSNLDTDTSYPYKDFRGFPQYIQANSEIVLRLGQDRFFPDPYQFISSTTIWRYTV